MPIYGTRELLLVCREDFRAQMNAGLTAVDGSTGTMSMARAAVGDPGGPAVARIARWSMDDTMLNEIRKVLRSWTPLTGTEGVEMTLDTVVPGLDSGQRFWAWVGSVPDSHAHAALGITYPTPVE